MRRLRELVLGSPERLQTPSLRRVLRRGDDSLRVRAARALAVSADPSAPALLLDLLDDAVPGVRGAAARGLAARPSGAYASSLLASSARERCTTPLLLKLAAGVRCGRPLAEAAAEVEAHGALSLRTATGWRSPGAAAGLGPVALREQLMALLRALEVSDVDALRSQLAREGPSVEGTAALRQLAWRGEPADHAAIAGARHSAGRRGDHRVLRALGAHGDPRALPMLLDSLVRMDVDPGRGFAQRRHAAVALGQLGLPSALPQVLGAMEIEALEHEGRPGAGLGIQFPVRSSLLWAVGELQAPAAAPLLAGYLDNLHGSALGGFHLPAMHGLVKLGPPALPFVAAVAAGGPDAARINAVGVLEAMGAVEALGALADEPGPVGEAARAALEGGRP